MKNEYEKKIGFLQKTVDQALGLMERGNGSGQSIAGYYQNIKAYLINMRDNLVKFETLIKGKRKFTIGVFGCPSRGKSTLLNVLLGTDILPMKGKAGTTTFGTELSYRDSGGFGIIVKYNNNAPRTLTFSTEVDTRDELGELYDETNPENHDIAKIEITGPFNSFLGNDIVFVDTPGAEIESLSEEEKTEGGTSLKHDFRSDTERALSILSSVDIVIFCMTLKYKEKKDADFYNSEIKNKYHTINVITAGDKRDEGETNDSIKEKLRRDYKLVRGNTVVVSSKEALEKITKVKQGKQEIQKFFETEFQDENLEGFIELRAMINKLTTVADENIKKRIENFEELYQRLKKDAEEKSIRLPDLIISEEKVMRDFIEEIVYVNIYGDKLTLSRNQKKALRELAVEYGFSKRKAIKMAEKAIKEKTIGIRRFLWFLLKVLKIAGIVILLLVILLVVVALLG
jgi:GTPase Era involved in 16S rRNA processing